MFIKAALDHDAAAWELIPVSGPVQHSDASVPVGEPPRSAERRDFVDEVQRHLGCPSADVVTVLIDEGDIDASHAVRWVWWRDGGVRRLLLTAHEVYLLSDAGDTIERIRD